MKKKIAVFCSASFEIDPKYNKVARDFVRAASLRGYGIVTGGTIKGTMGEVSDELHACGGYHLGVIPRFMEQYVYPDLSEVIWTDTMAERKTLLREDTCAVVGIRTGLLESGEHIDLHIVHPVAGDVEIEITAESLDAVIGVGRNFHRADGVRFKANVRHIDTSFFLIYKESEIIIR